MTARPARCRAWVTWLRKFSFPRRYPIVQFPNAPLIIALVADEVAEAVHGSPHTYVVSVGYLAMTIWAYEELVHGVNLFRRLLGLAFVVILIMRVADAIHT